ncbi:uncharacterized protein LOC144121654 isoform X3 [Amblyomma americanum]
MSRCTLVLALAVALGVAFVIVIQPPPFSIKLPGITPVVKLVMGGSSKPQDFPGTP